MSNTVIKVENLSKKHILTNQNKERYTALRDEVANGVKRLGKKTPYITSTDSSYLSTSRSGQAFISENSKFKIQNSKFTLGVKGFTLVELAVVLVILGTIFMSVLKVESMVKNARIRQVVNQYRELRTAILVYKDKYGYLPGDDPYAKEHVGADSEYSNLVADGGGNGKIDTDTTYEYRFPLYHLAKAGLLKGVFDPSSDTNSRMINPYGGRTSVATFETGTGRWSDASIYNRTGLGIYMKDLPGDVAQAIDTILDDGINNTGSCVAQGTFTQSLISLVCFIE